MQVVALLAPDDPKEKTYLSNSSSAVLSLYNIAVPAVRKSVV